MIIEVRGILEIFGAELAAVVTAITLEYFTTRRSKVDAQKVDSQIAGS